MKNHLQNIDSSTSFFFAVLVLFLGLRALPLGANNVSADEPKEFNSEMFLLVTPDSGLSCSNHKNLEDSNISYLP